MHGSVLTEKLSKNNNKNQNKPKILHKTTQLLSFLCLIRYIYYSQENKKLFSEKKTKTKGFVLTAFHDILCVFLEKSVWNKMASLADTLVSKVLGHSAAEKAFRPWWDNFEDYLVYGLVMLGKFFIVSHIWNQGTSLGQWVGGV